MSKEIQLVNRLTFEIYVNNKFAVQREIFKKCLS